MVKKNPTLARVRKKFFKNFSNSSRYIFHTSRLVRAINEKIGKSPFINFNARDDESIEFGD